MTRRKTVLASDFTSICYMVFVYSQYSDGLILWNCSPVMPTSHIVNNLLTSKHFFFDENLKPQPCRIDLSLKFCSTNLSLKVVILKRSGTQSKHFQPAITV